MLGFLQKADADVILLIEVNDRWMEAFKPLSKDYAYSLADPREDNFGIAIFSRQPLINDRVLNLGSTGVPSIATDLTIGGEKVHLLGTHPFPPGTPTDSRLRNEQLRQIAQYVRQQHSLVIVAGDLNSTPWSPYFRDLLRESGLKNTSQGLGLFPSWPCWMPLARIPLDYCLVSPPIQVIDKRLGPDVGSDHRPVITDLQIPTGADSAQTQ